MSSVIDICNRALARIGNARIQSLDEGSSEASYCKLFYDSCRQQMLRMHPWQFATKTDYLALTAESPSDYAYSYQKPSDCIRLIALMPLSSSSTRDIPYAMRGNRILTDCEDAAASYVYDVSEPNAFDAAFCDALAYLLASEIAMPLTGSPQLLQAMLQQFRSSFNAAKAYDASEGKEPADTIIDARS